MRLVRCVVLLSVIQAGGCSWLWDDAPDVDKVATLAKKIEADPDQAETLLREAGTTRKQFETDLYKIAEDPEASAAYAKALR